MPPESIDQTGGSVLVVKGKFGTMSPLQCVICSCHLGQRLYIELIVMLSLYTKKVESYVNTNMNLFKKHSDLPKKTTVEVYQ